MIDCLFLALIPVSAPWLMYAAKRPYTSQVYSILAHDIHLDRPHLNTSCRFLHPSPAMLLRMRLSPNSSRSLPFAHWVVVFRQFLSEIKTKIEFC